MFDENEAFELWSLLADYDDGTPKYSSVMQKLHDVHCGPQDCFREDLLLILNTIKEYFSDTAKDVTPSYASHGLPSPSVSAVLSQRELLRRIDVRIRRHLGLLPPES